MSFNPSEHMIPLKGKDYLQVAWRLVWFRDEHPDWGISTEIINYDPAAKHCIFRAVICDAEGAQKSSGTGSESAKDFGDYIEKAETKAVGRALAMLGYGTQFCADELDEGERIVDSPIERKPKKPAQKSGPAPKAEPAKVTEEHLIGLRAMCTAEQLSAICRKYGVERAEDLPDDKAVIMVEKMLAMEGSK